MLQESSGSKGIECLWNSSLLFDARLHVNAWTSPLTRTQSAPAGMFVTQKFMSSKTLHIQQACSYLFFFFFFNAGVIYIMFFIKSGFLMFISRGIRTALLSLVLDSNSNPSTQRITKISRSKIEHHIGKKLGGGHGSWVCPTHARAP